MKDCTKCQAACQDDAQFCPACGAPLEESVQEETTEMTEETILEAPVDEDGFEVIPEESAQKKSYGGLIAIGVLVVLLIVAIIIGKSAWDKKKTEVPQEPAAETTEPTEPTQEETPAYEEVGQPEVQPAHHVNAYGYNSHSIHYTQAEDGTFTYDYQNENGETVTVTAEEMEALLDQVIATSGDMALTNRDLLYFYDEQYYNFNSQYGTYLSFLMDTTLPLDQQLSFDNANTWQQSFVTAAVEMFHQTAAITAAAKEAGFALTAEEEDAVYATMSQIGDMAVQYGYGGVDEYLQAYYGPAANTEHYVDFFSNSQYANGYLGSLVEQMSVSEEELLAYYEKNVDMMQSTYGVEKIDKPVVDVRHILITPETTTDAEGNETISDEAWATAEAEAQRIYEEWKAGAANETTFNELAQANTDDPGSLTNGGLYQDVYPGQMVTEFNDWCFTDGRKTGDTDIVKTSYGYHIMYFVGEGEEIYWQTVVRGLITNEMLSEEIEKMQSALPIDADYSKAILLTVEEPTLPTTTEETP